MTIRFVVFGIFANNNKFLFYREIDEFNNEEFYRPLGGGVEFNKGSQQALSREIYEEIGEEIINIKEFGVLENIFNFRGIDKHEIYKGYFAEFANSAVYNKKDIFGSELSGTKFTAEWVSLETLLDEKTKVYPRGLKEMIKSKFHINNRYNNYKTDKLHLAIIPDGSRRWAKNKNLTFYEGYSVMVQKLSDIVEFAFAKGVKTISLYLASTQNLLREKTLLRLSQEQKVSFAVFISNNYWLHTQ